MSEKVHDLTEIALLSALITITGAIKLPSLLPGMEFQLSAPLAVAICVVFGFKKYILAGLLSSTAGLILGTHNLFNVAIAMQFRLVVGAMIALFGRRHRPRWSHGDPRRPPHPVLRRGQSGRSLSIGSSSRHALHPVGRPRHGAGAEKSDRRPPRLERIIKISPKAYTAALGDIFYAEMRQRQKYRPPYSLTTPPRCYLFPCLKKAGVRYKISVAKS